MALTQNERNKKYNQKFKRNDIKIPLEKWEVYNNYIKAKGFNSINDFVNIVIDYDIQNNIIPCKTDLLNLTNDNNI